MGRGTYKRADMTQLWHPNPEELKSCGAAHPNYPNITCISTTKCTEDWHITFYKGKLVYFGRAAEAAAVTGKLAHAIIPIK